MEKKRKRFRKLSSSTLQKTPETRSRKKLLTSKKKRKTLEHGGKNVLPEQTTRSSKITGKTGATKKKPASGLATGAEHADSS
jgi:hypothetical protein